MRGTRVQSAPRRSPSSSPSPSLLISNSRPQTAKSSFNRTQLTSTQRELPKTKLIDTTDANALDQEFIANLQQQVSYILYKIIHLFTPFDFIIKQLIYFKVLQHYSLNDFFLN